VAGPSCAAWRRGAGPSLASPVASLSLATARIEQDVVALCQAHPAWGRRKISQRLRDLGHIGVPAPSMRTGVRKR
jgi:hypothetical protein